MAGANLLTVNCELRHSTLGYWVTNCIMHICNLSRARGRTPACHQPPGEIILRPEIFAYKSFLWNCIYQFKFALRIYIWLPYLDWLVESARCDIWLRTGFLRSYRICIWTEFSIIAISTCDVKDIAKILTKTTFYHKNTWLNNLNLFLASGYIFRRDADTTQLWRENQSHMCYYHTWQTRFASVIYASSM